jgi:hypothetical protein
MSTSCTIRRSPSWAYACSFLLILASLASHLFSLDRYPTLYIDESFFNYPAISYLEGRGFKYRVSPAAPYGDDLWAYHGPFYPRLQVLTFSVLGISEYNCRLPQLAASHLALLLLCSCLLSFGLFRTSLIVAFAWLGDRSSQEVLYGRMEGLYLLCLVAGFISLLYAFRGRSTLHAFLAGVCLGTAVGFHPVTGFFLLGGALLVAVNNGRASAGAFVGGASIPALLVSACVYPNLMAALEQFLWHSQAVEKPSLITGWLNMFQTLRWSKYWPIGLVLATVWLTAMQLRRLHCTTHLYAFTDGERIGRLAACFAIFGMLGLLLIARSAIFPYYLVAFTIWPVIAISSLSETKHRSRTFHISIVSIGFLLFLTWLPSAGWNLMRLRESVLHYRALETSAFQETLSTQVPPGAVVTGSPEFFILGRGTTRTFIPLPWYASQTHIESDAWLLLSELDYRTQQRFEKEALSGREVVVQGPLYPQSGPFQSLTFVLLSPKSPASPESTKCQRLYWPGRDTE